MLSTPKLKIGFVFDDSLDKPDGVQQYVLSIGSWLSAQGHTVDYLVGKTDRKDIAHVHSLSRNVHVRFNGNGLSIPLPTPRSDLKTLLKSQNYDVLHVQVPYSPWLAGRIVQLAPRSTAVFGTFHIVANSRLVTIATHALAIWTRSSTAKFDQIVSVSSAAQNFALQTYGLKTTIIPNAINYQRFHLAKPLPKYRDDKITILFLGRLVPRKGCSLLLRAIATLKDAVPAGSFRVVVCGKGPELAALQKYSQQHGLEQLVEFVGFVSENDKPRYYASADIAVFPSSGGESFGIVLIEAMASGRACVLGGDNSGYRSVLESQPDLLFDPKSADGLAVKLQAFITNQPQREAMAGWGMEYAKQFDQAVVGQQLLTCYEQALHKRAKTEIIPS